MAVSRMVERGGLRALSLPWLAVVSESSEWPIEHVADKGQERRSQSKGVGVRERWAASVLGSGEDSSLASVLVALGICLAALRRTAIGCGCGARPMAHAWWSVPAALARFGSVAATRSRNRLRMA